MTDTLAWVQSKTAIISAIKKTLYVPPESLEMLALTRMTNQWICLFWLRVMEQQTVTPALLQLVFNHKTSPNKSIWKECNPGLLATWLSSEAHKRVLAWLRHQVSLPTTWFSLSLTFCILSAWAARCMHLCTISCPRNSRNYTLAVLTQYLLIRLVVKSSAVDSASPSSSHMHFIGMSWVDLVRCAR